jgi:hypothetical protein
MDDLLVTLLAKPEPSAEARAEGRARLVAATRRPARRKRFTWPAVALGAAATATAGIVVAVGLTPTATPDGPPAPRASGRQILLAAATTAVDRPARTGTYWHVKTRYQNPVVGLETRESWIRRDGREYTRDRHGRPVHTGGGTAFRVAFTPRTFAQIQRLPTDPAALRAEIDRLLRRRPLGRGEVWVGPGRVRLLVESLTDLLARTPAPPQVRAAAFRVLAGLPEVSPAGSAPGGGQTLLIRSPGGDTKVVVDPATSSVHGWTTTEPPPERRRGSWLANQSVSVLAAEWTPSLPAS